MKAGGALVNGGRSGGGRAWRGSAAHESGGRHGEPGCSWTDTRPRDSNNREAVEHGSQSTDAAGEKRGQHRLCCPARTVSRAKPGSRAVFRAPDSALAMLEPQIGGAGSAGRPCSCRQHTRTPSHTTQKTSVRPDGNAAGADAAPKRRQRWNPWDSWACIPTPQPPPG
jgi:hypothetical protein